MVVSDVKDYSQKVSKISEMVRQLTSPNIGELTRNDP